MEYIHLSNLFYIFQKSIISKNCERNLHTSRNPRSGDTICTDICNLRNVIVSQQILKVQRVITRQSTAGEFLYQMLLRKMKQNLKRNMKITSLSKQFFNFMKSHHASDYFYFLRSLQIPNLTAVPPSFVHLSLMFSAPVTTP